ncbi:diacylglycerol kinase family protein [Marinifilum sp. D714]|uniref:diacylglycerol/lipid kinase family protein n=1 Tax=Marinifilum sp. D714 TaxID=2937523 RepID=UPI0027C95104|nr:diacylglycerol kinase family protein [Marinifilum sp. D714]MDQ2178405.1 diacylglycerol kinase family lipid kinase [Marinifilum sp. D714]
MEKILFIINPIAGKKAGKNINQDIIRYLDTDKFKPHFKYSEYAGHISEIAKQALEEKYKAIIVVGGDGTVNEAARVLVQSNVPMGIIPSGSGNGLARHLKIPLTIKGAVKLINKMQILQMDAIKINNMYSFCVAGVGFDAEVSRMFQKMEARGLFSYIIACLRCFNQSKNQNFIVQTKEKEYRLNGFMLCFANASQFGNNAYIAPGADVSDGIVDLVLVKKPSYLQIPLFAYKILTGTVENHSLYNRRTGKAFEITQENDFAHLDGEPTIVGTKFTVTVEEKVLRVIY